MICFVSRSNLLALNWIVKMSFMTDRIKGPFTNTCKGGAWCKKGGPENVGARKGGSWKKTLILPLKSEFIWFSMGLTPIFLVKKGRPEKFWGPKGGPWKFFVLIFFCIRPPLTSVCERSLTFSICRPAVFCTIIVLQNNVGSKMNPFNLFWRSVIHLIKMSFKTKSQ